MDPFDLEAFTLLNTDTRVNMIDPPKEVEERELAHLLETIQADSTVGVFAVVVRRPVPEFEERLEVHTQFIPLTVDARTLLALTHRAIGNLTQEFINTARGEEDDDG